jgi:hypothetical protein
MQRGKEPVFPIVISPHGALSFGTKQISTEEVVDAVGMTPEVVTALLTDLRNLLKNDPLLWSAFGTFTVKDNTVECVPNPHMPEVARLTPRVGPKAKRLDI